MKNILFIFLLLLSYKSKAQTETITITNSVENLLIHKTHSAVLTSNANVNISGELSSNISFIIRPDSFHRIIIKPQYGNTLKGQPTSTVKTTKGGGTGKITIAPNPVAKNLHVIIEGTQLVGYEIISLNTGVTYLENDSVSPTNVYDIDVTSLPAGNYVLKAQTTSGQILSANFIKL